LLAGLPFWLQVSIVTYAAALFLGWGSVLLFVSGSRAPLDQFTHRMAQAGKAFLVLLEVLEAVPTAIFVVIGMLTFAPWYLLLRAIRRPQIDSKVPPAAERRPTLPT